MNRFIFLVAVFALFCCEMNRAALAQSSVVNSPSPVQTFPGLEPTPAPNALPPDADSLGTQPSVLPPQATTPDSVSLKQDKPITEGTVSSTHTNAPIGTATPTSSGQGGAITPATSGLDTIGIGQVVPETKIEAIPAPIGAVPTDPNTEMSLEEIVANSPPPVFYDTQDGVAKGGNISAPKPPRPLRNLSADKNPGSKIIVVKKDAPGESSQAKFAGAQRAMTLGRYEAALSIYDVLLKKDKRDPEVLMGRAVALHKLGRFDAALGAYEQVLAVRPNTTEAEVNMLGLMAQRYPAVALQRLNTLHEKYPQRTDILAQMAVAHGNLGNLDEALTVLGMAAASEPTNALHLYNMAVIADRKGDKSQSVQYYEKSLEVDSIYGHGQTLPRSEIYARLAQIR